MGRICPRRAHPSMCLGVTRSEGSGRDWGGRGECEGGGARGSGSQQLASLPDSPAGQAGVRSTHQPCRWVEGHSNVKGAQAHT